MRERIGTLVLGIGNILWADEGFGVRAVEALHRQYLFPDSVALVDGGTQGLYLLPYVQAARRMLVFDAIDYGLAPGTLKVIRDGEIPAYLGINKMSLHQSSFQEVLSLARLCGARPETALLIGVQPEDLTDFGGSLRDSVKARLPEALQIALSVLDEWGVAGVPRNGSAADTLSASKLAIEGYEEGRPVESEACRVGDSRFLRIRAGRTV